MSTLTFESSRFGTVEIAADAVIEFPSGLIGLGGRRYALLSADADGAFHWLHSLEDASLAIPVTNPWLFFDAYEVELSDADTDRVGSSRPDVWVTVRAGSSPEDFSANLRAPIVIARRPFVQPREVRLEKGSDGRIELVVGQAFALDAALPDEFVRDLDPSALDETKLVLSDFDDTERERTDADVILRARIVCNVVEEAMGRPFQTEIPVEFGAPPQKRRVKVFWPGR